ncbi:MAG: DUF58 domain-containing protein [Acidimicrobiales bacterium]
MPTRRGWCLALWSLGLAVGGRVFGVQELFALAAATAALVLGATVYVRGRRFCVDAARTLSPGKLMAGAFTEVELSVANRGHWRSPVLDGFDLSPAGVSADGGFLLAHLAVGAQARIRYRSVAPFRGLRPVGPLLVRLADPFGVAVRMRTVLGPSTLVVHPRADVVVAPPRPEGQLVPAPRSVPAMAQGDEDFLALRLYQHGDDLRRVHWPSTARLDELVVRQDEAPQPWECVVVVDTRAEVHDPRSLEEALSAAAGIVRACVEEGVLVRLVTTGGVDTGLAGGAAHLEAIWDGLATVATDGAGRGLDNMAGVLGPCGWSRTVVLLTTSCGTDSVAGTGPFDGLRAASDLLVVACLASDKERGPANGIKRPGERLAADHLVEAGPGQPLAAAWNRELG